MAKTVPINIHAEASQYSLLTRAAARLNKEKSAFILDVACREAENVLLDQRLFQLSEQDFAAFEAALEAPVSESVKLKELMTTKAPWEK